MVGELQTPLWEWWIVIYFFLGGVAGGAYFLAAIVELVGSPRFRPVARMGYYIAFPLSILCAIALILDLGRPERFWHMIVYSRTFLPWPKWDSPMSVGAYALLGFGLFSFLSFVDTLIETGRLPWAPLRERYSGIPRMIYAVIGAIFGFFLTAYTGVLITTTHLPIWTGTPLLGALFAASGAATGAAAIALGLALTQRNVSLVSAWKSLRRIDIVAIILEVILLAGFLILLGRFAQPLLTGLSGILLIVGVLILGLLVPLGLHLYRGARNEYQINQIVLISALVLIGGLLMRTTIILGGQGLL